MNKSILFALAFIFLLGIVSAQAIVTIDAKIENFHPTERGNLSKEYNTENITETFKICVPINITKFVRHGVKVNATYRTPNVFETFDRRCFVQLQKKYVKTSTFYDLLITDDETAQTVKQERAVELFLHNESIRINKILIKSGKVVGR